MPQDGARVGGGQPSWCGYKSHPQTTLWPSAASTTLMSSPWPASDNRGTVKALGRWEKSSGR